jgi:DNA gyrase subunit A
MVNRTLVSEIRIVGRNTQGVRVMDLKEGDKISSLAKIAREDDAETPAGETLPPEVPDETDNPGGETPPPVVES